MQCPRCAGSRLKTETESESKLELERCPDCKGLWFDRDELSGILGQRAEQNLEIPKYAARNPKVSCPKCEQPLYEFCYPGTLTLVDACINCGGFWLDEREWREIGERRDPANQMTCPKCATKQPKAGSCSSCGIVIDNYLGLKAAVASVVTRSHDETDSDEKYRRGSPSIFNQLQFVRDELIHLPDIDNKPPGGVGSFASRTGYALSLGLKEKEIFVFGLLQWVAVGLAYLLWVQMLDWIPEEVWRSTEDSDSGSIADVVLFVWSILCIGLAAFPIGILTGCMGAAHLLHRQGQDSTIAQCLHLVLPRSWPLWMFHWIDGYITARQILERLPKDDDHTTPTQKALDEALYYAWKLGVAGVLPGILTGNSLIRSGKNSILFVKDNLIEVAKLRAGYSVLCWVVGIGAYIGTIALFMFVDIVPKGDEVYSHIYTFYLWAAVPILVAVSIVMLLLRPIYVISICDMYSDYLEEKGRSATIPAGVSKPVSALVTFLLVCIVIATVFLFRDEMGISEMLATPYGAEPIVE